MEGINESLAILDNIWTDPEDKEVSEGSETEEHTETDVEEDEESPDSTDVDDDDYEPDYDEIEAPEFVPETYRRIPKFENQEKELEWYKDNYKNVVNAYKTEEFRNTVVEQYKDALINADKDVDELRTIQKAFKDNPELMIKLYYPEYLIQQGIQPRYSEEERVLMVERALEKEFGSDFKEKYNPAELVNGNSLSSKMFKKQTEMLEAIEKEELKYKQDYEASKPDPAKLQARIQEERQKYFSDYNDEQFDKFIKEVQEWEDYSLLDIHRMKYFDKYMEVIYKQGEDAGRKAIAKELKTLGKEVPAQEKPKEKKEDEFSNYLTSRIPRY